MNAGYAQELYEQFRRDPASVDPEWRALFESGQRGIEPPPAPPAPLAPPGPAAPRAPQSLAVPTATSFRDVPVGVLDERRRALNAALAPAKVSYTHLIAWALVQAARQHPV